MVQVGNRSAPRVGAWPDRSGQRSLVIISRWKFSNHRCVNFARPASPATGILLDRERGQAAHSAGDAASWPWASSRAKQSAALHLLNLPGMHAVAVATSRLGTIHRRIGVAQQASVVIAVLGIERDANAATDLHAMLVKLKRLPDRLDDALHHAFAGLSGLRLGQHDDELVATDPGNGVGNRVRVFQIPA